MYKHILIPIDGSNCSKQAVKEGLKLAKAFDAKVTFLTVFEIPTSIAYSGLEKLSYKSSLVEDLRSLDKKALAEAEELARESGVGYESKFIDKDITPVKAILDEEADHDLTVIGSHGRKGLDRFMLGSVTENVLRRSQIPHLVVHPPPE